MYSVLTSVLSFVLVIFLCTICVKTNCIQVLKCQNNIYRRYSTSNTLAEQQPKPESLLELCLYATKVQQQICLIGKVIASGIQFYYCNENM